MDMISASSAETHRFGRAKRHGYDSAEVDAVVSRLIETLRGYEVRIEKLEVRLSEADASADAIRRTFIAAENTRDEILAQTADEVAEMAETARNEAAGVVGSARDEASEMLGSARSEAAETVETARNEAAEITELAKSLHAEMAAERERILVTATATSQEMLTAAEITSANRVTAAAARAEILVEDAAGKAAKLQHEAAAARRASSVAGAWITRRAHENARSIVSSATAEADTTVREAALEAEVLRGRVVSLQAAVTDLQIAATDLASLASNGCSVIDLKTIEALSSEPEPPVVLREEPPMPRLSVSEAMEELEELDRETADPVVQGVEDPGPPTYYQRTTGVPLRERIKIARASS